MTKQTNKAIAANKVTLAAVTGVMPATETVVATVAPANSTTVVQAIALMVPTKADKARTVFAEAYPDGKNTTMQRKDIINKMISDAGLTKAGAATYLQNMKKKAGIVQSKATSIPQTA